MNDMAMSIQGLVPKNRPLSPFKHLPAYRPKLMESLQEGPSASCKTQKARSPTGRNVDSKERTRKKRPETILWSMLLPMARSCESL